MKTSLGSCAVPEKREKDTRSIGHVAIVDDDAAVRQALARLIRAHSHHVETYQSGREFLASLNKAVPACLIVDLQMAEMTGLELLHRVASTGLRIPAIIVTARDEPGLAQRCENPGTVAFLVKPVMKDPLLKAIETAMGGCDG
jgi:FixJ family two-component response regulator